MTNPLCAQCVFSSVTFFENFRVSGPDTEHKSVFLFVPGEKQKRKERPKGASEDKFVVFGRERQKTAQNR